MSETEGPGNPRLRPNRAEHQINPVELRAILLVGATVAEVAAFFGIGVSTAEKVLARDPYRALYEKTRSERKLSLRRAQTRLAMAGNVGMLIWLGKQELGQRDLSRHEVTVADQRPVEQADYADLTTDELRTLEAIASAREERARARRLQPKELGAPPTRH